MENYKRIALFLTISLAGKLFAQELGLRFSGTIGMPGYDVTSMNEGDFEGINTYYFNEFHPLESNYSDIDLQKETTGGTGYQAEVNYVQWLLKKRNSLNQEGRFKIGGIIGLGYYQSTVESTMRVHRAMYALSDNIRPVEAALYSNYYVRAGMAFKYSLIERLNLGGNLSYNPGRTNAKIDAYSPSGGQLGPVATFTHVDIWTHSFELELYTDYNISSKLGIALGISYVYSKFKPDEGVRNSLKVGQSLYSNKLNFVDDIETSSREYLDGFSYKMHRYTMPLDRFAVNLRILYTL